ncbi:bile acid:sodium symporter family protein [Corynebacterium sp. sy017]|uniref:bile acid:sodium symporter family protein n=1 Tax=unclassified Corynebacterium TaxID=2624378 RepID=UPI001184FBC3|nr:MULTISPECIES: bile acid:sodium symporter family protein [unclassified Corynebacterium]MBP3089045.1 bile acid:sodium symporter family protein [Corynebacterium sp. sy017]TSD91363.1 bile acid:sodium symporter family protein [Corynebacterium sp. SY003]
MAEKIDTPDISKADAAKDKAAFVAALGFPILVIIGGFIGLAGAESMASFSSWVSPLLGIVMFGMGLTLRPVDFVLVARRPIPVLIGVVAQYLIMPLTAVLIVWLLHLPSAIAVGVVLVGCSPGGTSSNVVSYLCRGDVALSVTITSISTLLSPILTPMLTLWLAGSYLAVAADAMAISIVKAVLLPVLLGLVVRLILPKLVEKITVVLPWISVLAISMIVAIVVGNSKEKILSAGLIVFIAVVAHNLIGYLLGYVAGRITRQSPVVARTLSVEVGMQNSGLAASLATQYFEPLSALPAAVFSVWHNLSGAMLAALWRWRDRRVQNKESIVV